MWEIGIKRRVGKLRFSGPLTDTIGRSGFYKLPILPIDCEWAGDLDWQHSDPLDRLLVTQAMRLSFTLETADRAIRGFGVVAQVWAAYGEIRAIVEIGPVSEAFAAATTECRCTVC